MDEDVIDFAGKIFDLARAGDAAGIAAYVDAGVPVDLTNDRGDTLLMLAAYHGHDAAVRVLLERGQRRADVWQAGVPGLVQRERRLTGSGPARTGK